AGGAPGAEGEARGAASQCGEPHGCAPTQHRGWRQRTAQGRKTWRQTRRRVGTCEKACEPEGVAERRPGAILRRIAFDPATWQALDGLAKDGRETIQELADEAFRDLLKKPRRPTPLREMLRESTRPQPANDHDRQPRRR